MFIEDKAITDISGEDIEALKGTKERNRLEFKEQLSLSDRDKLELLRDICALANADGGLIIIGAKESNSQCTEFINVERADIISESIKQCVLDGIEERLVGMQIKPFVLSSDETVLIVQVPSSYAKPHMVKKDSRTEFWKRYDTHKRLMTIAEIRQAFLEEAQLLKMEQLGKKIDTLSRQISTQESKRQLEQVTRTMTKSFEQKKIKDEEANASQYHKITDTKILLKKIDTDFKKEMGSNRTLRLTITPNPILPQNLFDPSDERLLEILRNPPDQRYAGWNMENTGAFKRTIRGFELLDTGFRDLLLFRNGHFEFRTSIDASFWWKQDPKEAESHPLLYPLPVVEYPVSFLRLAKRIFAYLKYNGAYLWRMLYYNINGCQMRPYHPRAVGYTLREGQILNIINLEEERTIDNNFEPSPAAYDLIKELYFSAGFTVEHIPFFDEKRLLHIPE